METTSITIDNLNDLIQIHNDRIAGYKRAIEDLQQDDVELSSLFTNMIGESHQFKMELGTEVQAMGGDIETDTSTLGKIHRAWMNIKDAFNSDSDKPVLENCEFGEDAALKAYNAALEDEHIPEYIRQILTRQQSVMQAAHDKIKALRDARG